MKRGDVVWARLSPVQGSEQSGTRPVILVSRQSLLDTRRTVLTVPLTSYRGQKMLPVHVLIRVPDGGIRNDSLAVADQMRAIDKSRLGALIGTLSAEALREVELAIAMALDLP